MFIYSVLMGLIIGSFLNVCIYRIPRNQSINYPPSNCQSCHHRLGVLDLVPVLSYMFLRGRCRYCGDKVSIQYPMIEMLNAIGYLLVYHRFGFSLETLLGWGFISVVIVLTMTDINEMLLPTKIIIFGSVWAVVGKGILSYQYQDITILIDALLAGVIGYGVVAMVFWLALKLMKREGMGYGDVRYLGMLGLFTSPMLVWLTLMIGCIVGAVYGVALYYYNGRESVHFPFGPFLSIGAVVSYFYGHAILQAYWNWCLGQIR